MLRSWSRRTHQRQVGHTVVAGEHEVGVPVAAQLAAGGEDGQHQGLASSVSVPPDSERTPELMRNREN